MTMLIPFPIWNTVYTFVRVYRSGLITSCKKVSSFIQSFLSIVANEKRCSGTESG